LSDGAVPEGERAEALLAAASSLPAARTDVLVLLIRPGGDEPASPPAQELLRALPARFGGVMRTIDPNDLRGSVAEVVGAARRGGDLFSVAVAAGGRKVEAFAAVPPGSGQTHVFRIPGSGGPTLSGRRGGEAFSTALAAAPVAASAL